ncbi:TetR family transcriptional regulator [Mesorhizobium sp. B2-4-19]|uniref:TetR/AcrR family transcriptional regulator n=1 Tax=Mesorhizobium sp. B2-4-19 TaxID=2589930 RepID=UPI00112E21F3|nr:TetR family transcriptional regulator [Mesorhizobium sp. B2-4-19]TPK65603.1 TetR family transcriptional regulator [Mesorhizobium sp. B2-4-19]
MARVAAAERRQQILEAAFRVIYRDGVSAATTRAICHEAGVQQGIFHYCFHTKRKLLEQLITVAVKDLVDASLPSADLPDDANVMRAILSGLWQEVRKHAERQLPLYELTITALRDPELADLARWQYYTYFETMEATLGEIEHARRIQWTIPRSRLARMIVSAIDGLTLGWLADHDDQAAEAALEGYAAAFGSLSKPMEE